jgi:triacylglycerol lipase
MSVCLAVLLYLTAGCGYDESLIREYRDAGGQEQPSPDVDAGVSYADARPDSTVQPDVTTDVGPDTADPPPSGPRPILLAHGFAGFEHLADVEQMTYYFGVADVLEEEGETIITGEVDPFNDSYDRGEELIDQIEEVVADSDYDRINVIGHSQGGLDARYAAHHRPDLVAAVVTISTPHQGTLVSDIALEYVDHPLLRDIIDGIAKLFGRALYDKTGEGTSFLEAMRQFSEPKIEEFNRRITNQPDVFYASIAGRTDGNLGENFCHSPNLAPFLKRWEEVGDPVDPLLSVTEGVLDGAYGGRPNDGLVRVSDAKWGEFWGCIPADHLDEVGQLIGDDPGAGNDWEHIDFYRNLVDHLHDEGF